jgi:Flp pilus assembly protein TadG
MVETAIVLTTFFTLIFGFFEYSRFMMLRQLMQNAAREGARQAVVNEDTMTTANVQAVVTKYLVNVPVTSLNIQVYETDSSGNNIGAWTNSPFGTGVAVQIDANCTSILPTFGVAPGSLHFSVKSIMRCEAN